MQFKVMVLEISNQLLESDAYGREEKGLTMHLPTTAYLYASLTEVKIASSEWLLWVIEEKIEFLRSEMAAAVRKLIARMR